VRPQDRLTPGGACPNLSTASGPRSGHGNCQDARSRQPALSRDWLSSSLVTPENGQQPRPFTARMMRAWLRILTVG